MAVDDQYTKSLLHFDGNLTDESGKTWTAYGGAATSTAQKKFGTHALYLDGTDDYINTYGSSDFAFGTGDFTVEHIIDESLFGGANKLFAQITLPTGAQVPVHTHEGNNETYYVLKGKGTYTDEGKEYPVEAGNVTFCKDGGTHGLKNTGSEDLVFIALIANTLK